MPGHNTEKLPPPAPSSAKDKDHQLSRKPKKGFNGGSVSEDVGSTTKKPVITKEVSIVTLVAATTGEPPSIDTSSDGVSPSAATTSATGATSGAAGPGATDAHVQSEDIAQAECVTEMTNPKDKEVMEAGDYIRSVPTRLARAKVRHQSKKRA
ncbi:hypothetical protein PC116_g16325 [Phytophthora cactorum]|nr:hypothetical protein PC111_g19946 [Phytophthora cactorum]KAG2854961.1 hypothetical protein PC113_g12863 [Phytophthora cactorum]KAG2897535.1 hypothetical protein PC115_g17137 [Phytophthora cactorum]KAG3011001.1 hypothetical protein PC119_g13356 [Phytophthora cactorum]KAG3155468.1 hypothetical protein C6341_g15418 [Phytophthora cactorum]